MDYFIKIKKKKKHLLNDRWVWRMAWIEGKHNFRRLLLFTASIVIGIASIVAIDSFNENLKNEIDFQAKDLLGADLVIRSNSPIDSVLSRELDTLGTMQATDIQFVSMALFMNVHGGTRLVQVVAREGEFPFYGEVVTLPENAMRTLAGGTNAVLDENLAIQYEVSSGDSIKLGKTIFKVQGIVKSMPGTNAVSTSFTPSIYIPRSEVEGTGLIQFGSRSSHRRYIKLSEKEDIQLIEESLRPVLREYDYRYDTVEEQKEDMGRAVENLYRFFNLLAFVALILGSIGVSSSIHIYVQQKKHAVAVLRCMGASGWQAFNIFFIQSVFLGILGSIVGIGLGILIQYTVPLLFGDVIPLEVHFNVVWLSLLKGLLIGVSISVLFSIMPLTMVRKIPPLIVIRSFFDDIAAKSKSRYISLVLIVLGPWFFAVWQTGSWLFGTLFMAGLILAFGLLFLVAKLLILVMKQMTGLGYNFTIRQGMSNLFRPNNQTVILVIVIGLGAFLLATLGQIQTALLGQVEFMGGNERSNTVLFDIQPYQKDEVVKFTKDHDLPIKQLVPIVTTRLKSLNGKLVDSLKNDTTRHIPRWALRREYRVTYRDSLIESETLLKGSLRSYAKQGDSIFVSISESMLENLKLDIGDEVIFDVQGIPFTTYIGSVREVDWQRIQTNFTFVFPGGVIDQAPQFYVLMTRTPTQVKASIYQQELVQFFPNVSAIDLRIILQTIDGFMDKVAYVIRFMALFSVVTGLIVLIGAISNSRYARLKENVLLRTLGAVRKQIVRLTLVEYSLLGIMAGVTGSFLSIISAWILAVFFFKIEFSPDLIDVVTVCLSVALITVIIGWINTRSVYGDTPIDILRKEGG
ncbi:MAG: FtsX-like permease family protein [Bacteroidota bacterium]